MSVIVLAVFERHDRLLYGGGRPLPLSILEMQAQPVLLECIQVQSHRIQRLVGILFRQRSAVQAGLDLQEILSALNILLFALQSFIPFLLRLLVFLDLDRVSSISCNGIHRIDFLLPLTDSGTYPVDHILPQLLRLFRLILISGGYACEHFRKEIIDCLILIVEVCIGELIREF